MSSVNLHKRFTPKNVEIGYFNEKPADSLVVGRLKSPTFYYTTLRSICQEFFIRQNAQKIQRPQILWIFIQINEYLYKGGFRPLC